MNVFLYVQSCNSLRRRSICLVEEILSNSDGTVAGFCRCIEKRHQSLAQELMGALKAETGELILEPSAQKEAVSLVFKTFGSSRRMSERDKKQISNMIALKSLIVQQESLKQIRRLEHDTKLLRAKCLSTERKVSEVNSRLRGFIEENRLKQLHNFVDMRSTTEVLMTSHAAKPVLKELEEGVDFVLARFSRILSEKEYAQYQVDVVMKPETSTGSDANLTGDGNYRNEERKFGAAAEKVQGHRDSGARRSFSKEIVPKTYSSTDISLTTTASKKQTRQQQQQQQQLQYERNVEMLRAKVMQLENVVRAKEKSLQVLTNEIGLIKYNQNGTDIALE